MTTNVGETVRQALEPRTSTALPERIGGGAAEIATQPGAESPQSGLAILRNIFLYPLLIPGAIVLLIRLFLY